MGKKIPIQLKIPNFIFLSSGGGRLQYLTKYIFLNNETNVKNRMPGMRIKGNSNAKVLVKIKLSMI